MKKQIALLLAAVLTLSLLAGCSGKAESSMGAEAGDQGETVDTEVEPRALAEAVYPKKAFDTEDGEMLSEASADWEGKKYIGQAPNIPAVRTFTQDSLAAFLGDAGKENRIYSPLNIYMALAMLAEITDGETRQQILDVLGMESIETLRKQAKAIWGSTYRDNETVTNILGSSIWLNQDVLFNQNTLNTLTDTYYASSYQGEMGSPEMNSALQNWLNEQTQGFLEAQVGGVTLDPDTVIALATTIYFKAPWAEPFIEEVTAREVFHGAAGDVTCDFMHQGDTMNYYWGDHYTAINRRLESVGRMWFILPDEGVEVTELLTDQQMLEMLAANPYDKNRDNCKTMLVHQSIPKFDVSTDLDLAEGLQSLGITDAFRPGWADFSPLTGNPAENEELCVSQTEHAARVAIDEEGIIAAAFTAIIVAGYAPTQREEIDFVLDRPFLFVVQSDSGLTLFAGIVNQI